MYVCMYSLGDAVSTSEHQFIQCPPAGDFVTGTGVRVCWKFGAGETVKAPACQGPGRWLAGVATGGYLVAAEKSNSDTQIELGMRAKSSKSSWC